VTQSATEHKTEPKAGLDRRRSLSGIPAWNAGVTWSPGDDNDIVISVVQRRSTGFLARFQPERWERRFQLDALGAFVVQQIDGKKTVLQITENFIKRFKVNRREAELATVAFLKTLLERGIISIGIP